jgi:hypothetical protein
MTNVLASKAVLASVVISAWSARKYDKKITEETNARNNANPDAGRYNKLLVAKKDIKELTAVASGARQFHYAMTLPWIDQGPRLLPTDTFMKHAEIRKMKADFDKLADQFAKNYPAIIEDAKKRLNGMFDPADYPDPALIRSKFSFDVKYLPCPDSEDFRVSLGQEAMDEIKSDLEARMGSAVDTAMSNVRERIVDVVGHMAEKLKGYAPGMKGKRAENTFQDSLVDNVRDLVDLLPSFNLTNDPKLDALIKKMRDKLCSVDAEELRDNEHERKYVAKQAAAILKEAQEFLA